ncbi:LacI family DNA-binding transcriptional regulator [Flavimaricola marinus]
MNLKQLSKTLGLSQTTVSRALNGYPEVSAATRIRIEKAARDHNYTPNIRARSLATGQALAIGHVIPVATRNEIMNPVFADFISGAATTYSKHGYELLLSLVEDGDEEATYRKLKSRASVDGVMIHSPQMVDPRVSLLKEIGLPFAVHGRVSTLETPYCWLDVNNRAAFRRATDYLLDLGHRRIALINGIETQDFAYQRRSGFQDAMAARGLPIDPALMRANEMTEEIGYRAIREMLALPRPPTAVMTSSMITAIGTRRGIEDAGLIMGRDVSVLTHDDELSYFQNGGETPIFTSTRSSVREAGRRLAEHLIYHINHPDDPPPQELLDADLRVGKSTGPVPATRIAS